MDHALEVPTFMQSSVHRDTTKTIQCLIDTQANKERHTNFPFEDDRHLFTTLKYKRTKENDRTLPTYRNRPITEISS